MLGPSYLAIKGRYGYSKPLIIRLALLDYYIETYTKKEISLTTKESKDKVEESKMNVT